MAGEQSLRRACRAAHGQRTGFALPMALLAVVVVGLVSALALVRFSMQSLAADRQVRGYIAHHAGLGLQEAVGRWVDFQSGSVASALAEDGHAFDLEMPDGSLFRVYMADGQGLLLSNVMTLPEDQALAAGQAYNTLLELVPPEQVDGLLRPVGPGPVSVQTAPEPVLRAAARSVLEAREAESLVRELTKAREADGEINRADLSAAIGAANIAAELRPNVVAILTAEPVLWLVQVELYERNGALLKQYEGYVSVDPEDNSGRSRTFLTFEEMPIQAGPAPVQ